MLAQILNDPLEPNPTWLNALYSGISLIINLKKTKLFLKRRGASDKELSVFGIGILTIHKSRITIDLWGPASEIEYEIDNRIEVHGADAHNRTYFALANLKRSQITGETFHWVAHTDRIQVQNSHRFRGEPQALHLSLTAPKSYVFPFSSIRTTSKEFAGRVLSDKREYAGYYGSTNGASIHAEPLEHLNLLKISIEHSVSPTDDWDSAEEALEYATGLPLLCAFSLASSGDARIAIFRQIMEFEYPGQGASPVDIRTDHSGFLNAFLRFYRYSQRNSIRMRRCDLHIVLHNVYNSLLSYTAVQIVTLCFSIEWLAQEVTPISLPGCLSSTSHTAIKEYIQNIEMESDIKSRLIGLISLARHPGTQAPNSVFATLFRRT